jgi:hypothetical protein
LITLNPNKFGYYSVGNKNTFKKLEAIEYSNIQSIPFKWHFNDDIFSALDWTKDPDIDLWDLYKQRAKQIRGAYDYVVLFYSGGSDSHNILNAWLDADCKIDEIATIWNYETTGEYQNHQNAEITNVVLPDIKRLREKGIEFKFRLIELPEFALKLFERWSTNFEYYINYHASINNPAKHLFRDYIKDYKDLIDRGKKVVFVWGTDKPIIHTTDDKQHFNFIDCIDNCVGPYCQDNFHKGWYDELFYWTPDCPLIPIKQSHIIKNFISICNDKKFYQSDVAHNGYNSKIGMYVNYETVKSLIYPKWSSKIFTNGKAHSFIFSERDDWFFRTKDTEVKKYTQIVKSFFNKVENIDINKTRQLLPTYSKGYFL